MDEEIEGLFETTTTRSNVISTNSYTTFYKIFQVLLLVTCWIGIIVDVLAVWILLRNKCLKPRTNTIVLLLFLHSALFLLTESSLASLFAWTNSYEIPTLYCMKTHVIPINQMLMCVFVLLLLSHTLMTTKKVPTAAILGVVYTLAVAYGIFMLVSCIRKERSYIGEGGYLSLFIFLYMTIATLVKDVNRCCRNRSSSIPLSDDAKFRLDISRIYIYNTIACFVILIVSLNIFMGLFYAIYILYLSVYLPPVYIFVYTYRANEVFRKRTLDILKCNFGGAKGEVQYTKSGVDMCTNEEGIVINFSGPETEEVPAVSP